MLKKYGYPILLFFTAVSLWGCGQGGGAPVEVESKAAEPITLRVYPYATGVQKEEWVKAYESFMKDKFPQVTIEWIAGQKLEDLIAAGEVPDILITGNTSVQSLLNFDIPQPLDELAKKHGTNLSVYTPAALSSVKLDAGQGERMYSLPYKMNYMSMAYNKDVFDRFGLGYPKDAMTWEETVDLAKRLTRMEGGVQYHGLVVNADWSLLSRGLSLQPVDPKTQAAKVNTDEWMRIFQLQKDILSIPGNDYRANYKHEGTFLAGNVAMMATWGNAMLQTIENGNVQLNWDVTTYPNFKESPGQNFEVSTNVFVLSKTSKHLDEAYKVISFLTSNSEVQEYSAKQAVYPVIKLDKAGEIFGQERESYKGKNVAALFKSTTRDSHVASEYDGIVYGAIRRQAERFFNNEIDVREALRAAEEEANKLIAEAKTKK